MSEPQSQPQPPLTTDVSAGDSIPAVEPAPIVVEGAVKPAGAPALPPSGMPTKYCFSCGVTLDARAEICPRCGVRQQPPPQVPTAVPQGRSKLVTALLAIFLGGFGVHKFYLGKLAQGVIYLIFFWTLIPALVGFVEGLWYLTMSDPEFQARYPV
ncbi:MAG TPA: TM2 domain-containing protein [Actinomycetes bacterium]|nr:TM2 domain-containing protein [Actinomycetes bacterium]